ncbi:MAG: hypothetical protein EOP65_01170 [Sphingomonas sp.]|nr:MAG: hypothetical protein EOP65_01170 [Sphingomonas sp.]
MRTRPRRRSRCRAPRPRPDKRDRRAATAARRPPAAAAPRPAWNRPRIRRPARLPTRGRPVPRYRNAAPARPGSQRRS